MLLYIQRFEVFYITELKMTDLNVQIVVISLSQLDEHSKQRKNGPSTEERALWPNHSNRKECQNHGHHTVEPLLQQAFPEPLWWQDQNTVQKGPKQLDHTGNPKCAKVVYQTSRQTLTYSRGVNVASEPAYCFWKGKTVNKLSSGAGFVPGNVLQVKSLLKQDLPLNVCSIVTLHGVDHLEDWKHVTLE